jgi:hypothetical protein
MPAPRASCARGKARVAARWSHMTRARGGSWRSVGMPRVMPAHRRVRRRAGLWLSGALGAGAERGHRWPRKGTGGSGRPRRHGRNHRTDHRWDPHQYAGRAVDLLSERVDRARGISEPRDLRPGRKAAGAARDAAESSFGPRPADHPGALREPLLFSLIPTGALGITFRACYGGDVHRMTSLVGDRALTWSFMTSLPVSPSLRGT